MAHDRDEFTRTYPLSDFAEEPPAPTLDEVFDWAIREKWDISIGPWVIDAAELHTIMNTCSLKWKAGTTSATTLRGGYQSAPTGRAEMDGQSVTHWQPLPEPPRE